MRRGLVLVALVAALLVMGLPRRCINQSKPGGAGNHTAVIIDTASGKATWKALTRQGVSPVASPISTSTSTAMAATSKWKTTYF